MKKLLLLWVCLFPYTIFVQAEVRLVNSCRSDWWQIVYNESRHRFNGTSFSTDSTYMVKKENNSCVQ